TGQRGRLHLLRGRDSCHDFARRDHRRGQSKSCGRAKAGAAVPAPACAPAHSESRRLRRERVAKMMIEVPEKYALEASSPAPITIPFCRADLQRGPSHETAATYRPRSNEGTKFWFTANYPSCLRLHPCSSLRQIRACAIPLRRL